MKRESRERLNAFVERVKHIETFSYFKDRESISGFEIAAGPDGVRVKFNRPPDEARDALVLHLRLFLQDKDRISLRSLAELQDDPGISAAWKSEHSAIRQELNSRLDQVYAQRPGGTLLHRDALYAVMFGKVAHEWADHDHHKLYREWSGDPISTQMLHSGFDTAVVWLSVAVLNLAKASAEELSRDAAQQPDAADEGGASDGLRR